MSAQMLASPVAAHVVAPRFGKKASGVSARKAISSVPVGGPRVKVRTRETDAFPGGGNRSRADQDRRRRRRVRPCVRRADRADGFERRADVERRGNAPRDEASSLPRRRDASTVHARNP